MSDGYKIYATEKYVEANYSLKSKLSTISLLASEWVGLNSPYRQIVTIDCVSGNSKVDLQPTESQIAMLQDAEISLVASNDNGVVTIYAIGGKPKEDCAIQVVITEANISNDGSGNVSGNNGGVTIEQAEAIKANTIARHVHNNINTLDKLSENDNNLIYGGKRIVDESTLAVVDEYNALYSLGDSSLLCYVSTDRVGFAPVALEAGIQYGGLYDYQDKSQLWIDPLLLNFFPCEAFTVTTESVLLDEGRNLYCHYEFVTDGLTYFYFKYFVNNEKRYVILFNNSSTPIVIDNITFPVGWGEYSYYNGEGNVAGSIDDYSLYRQSFGVPSLKFGTDDHFAELQNILSEKSTYSGVRGYYQYYNGRWQSINFAQISLNTNSAISSSHYHYNQDVLDTITPEIFQDKNIPAVYTLPETAKEGDLCLYAPQNTLTLAESGKRIYFDWEKFRQPVDEGKATVLTAQLIGNADGENVQSSIYRDENSCVCLIDDWQTGITFNVSFNSGVLDFASYGDTVYNSIEEIPSYYQLPQFDTIDGYDLSGNEYLFHTEYRLMKYQGGEWVEMLSTANVTDEQISNAVRDYLTENPIEGSFTVTDDGNGNVTIA